MLQTETIMLRIQSLYWPKKACISFENSSEYDEVISLSSASQPKPFLSGGSPVASSWSYYSLTCSDNLKHFYANGSCTSSAAGNSEQRTVTEQYRHRLRYYLVTEVENVNHRPLAHFFKRSAVASG